MEITIFKDIKEMKSEYDFSGYSKDYDLFSNENKKVLGKMKDELDGKLMTELICLRAKMYAYKTEEKEDKKLKGTNKVVVKNEITFEKFG